jgi:hypothetical protein
MASVSDLIQQAQQNFTSAGSSLTGGPLNNIFANGFSDPASNIANSQILNKSPAELAAQSSKQTQMESNPYAFASTWYPEKISNLGDGNYVIFDILATDIIPGASYSSNISALGPLDGDISGTIPKTIATTTYGTITDELGNSTQGSTTTYSSNPAAKSTQLFSNTSNAKGYNSSLAAARITKQSSGINAGTAGSRHTRIVNSIMLYTPPGVKTSYNTQYDTPETGIMGNLAGGAQGNGAGGFLNWIAGVAGALPKITNEILSAGLSAVPGLGDLKAVEQKITGRATNPHIEMVFKSVPFREFDFTFEFAPKNQTELERVQQILFLFRYHMQPELGLGNDFIVPSEFQITYMTLDKRNAYIPRISKCVLKSMDIEHGDSSTFSTFARDAVGSAPVYTKMTLKFGETEIMTKTTVSKGF